MSIMRTTRKLCCYAHELRKAAERLNINNYRGHTGGIADALK
ncbi:MAG: hypothetical protein V2A70_07305 [Candidatus Omnitrophota bacterium]